MLPQLCSISKKVAAETHKTDGHIKNYSNGMQQEAANKLCTVKVTFGVRSKMVLPNPTFRRVMQEREVDIFTKRCTSPGGMVVSIVKGQAAYFYHKVVL